MRQRLLWFSLVVAFGLAGCSAASDGVRHSNNSAPHDTLSARASTSSGANATAGAARVMIRSHCGVNSVIVDGVIWLADPPLGDHNPPPGWDENATPGLFTITSPGRAEFRGESGQEAHFRRVSAGAEDPGAGCE